jgi:predicted DNA binding CopG/RHH family protein
MKNNLDKDEQKIVESFEKGEWKSVSNVEEEINSFVKVAKKSLRKDKRINIRITDRDLLEIKRKAVNEGIPYQTLISSVLHKFLNGRLVEKAG